MLEGARYIAREIPGAHLHVLEGRCHSAHQTATAEWVEVLRRFLRADRPEDR